MEKPDVGSEYSPDKAWLGSQYPIQPTESKTGRYKRLREPKTRNFEQFEGLGGKATTMPNRTFQNLRKKRYREEFVSCLAGRSARPKVSRSILSPVTVRSVTTSECGKVALKTLQHLVTENVAEFSGQKLADQLSPIVTKSIVSLSATAPVVATSVGSTAAVASAIVKGGGPPQEILKKALIAASISVAAFWAAPTLGTMAVTVPVVGTIVNVASSVLGGYIGSKVHGTEEIFWKPTDPLDSYPSKPCRQLVGRIYSIWWRLPLWD